MTDTAPAAAIGLPSTFDRRSFLATLAAAGVLNGSEALAAKPGAIELAYAAWFHVAKLADAACEATWKVEETYEEPARPGWNPFAFEGGHKDVCIGGGKYRCYLDDSAENIAHLRQLIDAPETVFTLEGWTPDMFPPRVESAQRTLAAILTWQTEARSRADACGLTAAREHETPLIEDANTRRGAILAATPSTYREAAFQASLLGVDWDESAGMRLCGALRALADIPDYFDETAAAEGAAA